MIHASDTPPDGDFAAYVERLASKRPAAGGREDLFKSRPEGAAISAFATSTGMASVQATAPDWSAISFLTHAKWVVAIWLASQALAQVVPGAGFLFIPALVAYAAWVLFRSGSAWYGPVAERIRGLARQAAEEAKNAQQQQRPKK